MSDSINAAQRLYDLLSKIQKADPNPRFDHTLANILSIPSNDKRLVLSVCRDLLDLITKAKKDAEVLREKHKELYLKPIEVIETKYTRTDFSASVQSFKVDPEILQALIYAAHYLDEHDGEKLVSKEELDKLRLKAEELVNDIIGSDLPVDLKNYLISALDKFRYAIITYSINGLDGLKRAIEENSGTIYRVTNTSGESEPATQVIYRFLTYVSTIADVIAVAQFTQNAIPIIQNLLVATINRLSG